jgi:TolB protein
VWASPIDGGPPRQITKHAGIVYHPSWSPDGQTIVFAAVDDGNSVLWRVPADGGPETPLTSAVGWLSRWAPDGSRVFFTTTNARPGGNNLWSVDPRSGAERQLTNFSGRRGQLNVTALATDGKTLYFAWGEFVGRIWTVRVAGN